MYRIVMVGVLLALLPAVHPPVRKPNILANGHLPVVMSDKGGLFHAVFGRNDTLFIPLFGRQATASTLKPQP